MEGRIDDADRLVALTESETETESRVPAPLIRTGRDSDLIELLAIESKSFVGDRLSKRSFRHHLSNSNSDLLVAVDEHDIPMGYALISYRRRAKMARLDSLAILPTKASSGLGSALLANCEARVIARGIGIRLEVRADNTRAIGFYERRHYLRFGEIPDYYEDGETALLFYRPFA